MLKKLLNDLRKTVPAAFTNERPSIPWVDEKTITIDLKEIFNFRKIPIFPPIFVDPEKEVPSTDEEIEGNVRRTGTEALAWYLPFHQSERWGIYFRFRGICYLSNYFKTKSNLNDVNARIKSAFEVLFYHEFFHFLTEITASHMEMVYKKPIYNDYIKFLSGKIEDIFRLEESLANAYVLKRLPKRYHPRIKSFFDIQPPPYSKYRYLIEDEKFLESKRWLGAIMRIQDQDELIINFVANNFDLSFDEPFWEFLFNVMPERLFLPEIPIYFVIEREHPTSAIKFITPVFMGVRVAVYPADHPPPHIHVWIPADSKRDGRYLYPSLEPYMGARPLSNREIKKVQRVIQKYKDKIESIIASSSI